MVQRVRAHPSEHSPAGRDEAAGARGHGAPTGAGAGDGRGCGSRSNNGQHQLQGRRRGAVAGLARTGAEAGEREARSVHAQGIAGMWPTRP